MRKKMLLWFALCFFCATPRAEAKVNEAYGYLYEQYFDIKIPKPPKNFCKIQRNNGKLLFVRKVNRNILHHAGYSLNFRPDYEIELPEGVKYYNGVSDPFFIYPDNQAIIVSQPLWWAVNISRNDRYVIEKINFTELKDTICYDINVGRELLSSLESLVCYDFNSCNIHFKRLKRFLSHDTNFSIPTHGRKHIVIQKNNVQILLFNVKEENVEKWISLLLQIRVYPKNAEEVKNDERFKRYRFLLK